MDKLVRNFYRLLMLLSGLSMLAAFAAVTLGVFAREVIHVNIDGLDAYAGYAIAAALFFALPGTLQNGDHIRVTLLLDRLPSRWRGAFEWFCLSSALVLTAYIACYAVRSVWISYVTHDISPAADASPLWIPQLCMAIGCVAFALAFLDAIVARLRGREWFIAGPGSVAE